MTKLVRICNNKISSTMTIKLSTCNIVFFHVFHIIVESAIVFAVEKSRIVFVSVSYPRVDTTFFCPPRFLCSVSSVSRVGALPHLAQSYWARVGVGMFLPLTGVVRETAVEVGKLAGCRKMVKTAVGVGLQLSSASLFHPPACMQP
jgi:hypothetical protein